MAKRRRKATTKQHRGTVSRRKFIENVIVGSAATSIVSASPTVGAASPLPAVPSEGSGSARSDSHNAGCQIMTPEQGLVLAVVLNRLIPPGDGMPGAGEVGVARYIDEVLAAAPHLRRPIIGLLTQLPEADRVTGLCDGDVDVLLTRAQAHDPASFTVLLQATYTGYYSHPTVLTAIGWRSSGESAGLPEFFDAKLLRKVRARGAIYRQV